MDKEGWIATRDYADIKRRENAPLIGSSIRSAVKPAGPELAHAMVPPWQRMGCDRGCWREGSPNQTHYISGLSVLSTAKIACPAPLRCGDASCIRRSWVSSSSRVLGRFELGLLFAGVPYIPGPPVTKNPAVYVLT